MGTPLSSILIALLLVLPCCFCDNHHNLESKYNFRRDLHPQYTLYWNYNPTDSNLTFAVRVETTGWVGFGISPNGGMVGSDMVIGWVQNGRSYFNDRFATARSTPAVDMQQDWFLISAEEENGYTTLEFTRNYTSCDGNNQDRNITDGTSRIVWSFKNEDPPNGVNGSFIPHDVRGSASVNFLGGLRNATSDPPGTRSFDIRVDQVTIPSTDTTYWCKGFELPQEIQDTRKYMIRFSPNVTEGNTAHVHHMLVYLCSSLNTSDSDGGVCDDVIDSLDCGNATLIAGWAIGGEDFVYPPNVAYPIGGDQYQYVYIEMHYDNPNRLSGVVDSSGVTFFYIDTPREHDSGILAVGHAVNQYMIIPPKARDYTIYSFCPTDCTALFPQDGIHVFANLLHTHLLGVSITLHHLRASNQCRSGSGIEELKPIDSNPVYDFNFQETVHINEVVIRPGDGIMLTCTYNSENRNTVTLGGESTYEEMCLSFLNYYPRMGMTDCYSLSYPQSFRQFLSRHYSQSEIAGIFSNSPENGLTRSEVDEIFNNITWTHEETEVLENSLSTGSQISFCYGPSLYAEALQNVPSIGCPYEAPPVMLECPDSVDPTTNPTTDPTTDPTSGAVSLITLSVTVLLFAMIAMILIN